MLNEPPSEHGDSREYETRKEDTLNRNSIIHLRHFPAIAAGLLWIAGAATAGVERVIVDVDGIACPFCAYNIEKRMKTLNGIDADAEFTVSVERGFAALGWMPTVRFEPDAVREQIRRAGFTPTTIRITAKGLVARGDDASQLTLRSDATEQVIAIRGDERADRAQSHDLLRRRVDTAGEEPFSARVIGETRGDFDDDAQGWHLVMHRWEPVEYAALVTFKVDDMVCEHCARRAVESIVEAPGFIHVEADFQADRIAVWSDTPEPNQDVIRRAIEEAGFTVRGFQIDVRTDREPQP